MILINQKIKGHFRVPLHLCTKTIEVKCWFFILMQIKLIFTRKLVHLASFWKWRFSELRGGLLNHVMLNRTTMKMASRLIHLISKKTNWTYSMLFLLISKKHVKHAFLSFPCLAITSNFLITHYFHVRMVVLSCVHVPFYFSLPLIFTLLARCFLAASISHFLTAALNFHVFLATKFVSFVFNDSL